MITDHDNNDEYYNMIITWKDNEHYTEDNDDEAFVMNYWYTRCPNSKSSLSVPQFMKMPTFVTVA